MRVGLDIGSTTIKCAVLDEHDALIYSTYERHYSHILEKAQELLRRIDAEHLHGNKALLSITSLACSMNWLTTTGCFFDTLAASFRKRSNSS